MTRKKGVTLVAQSRHWVLLKPIESTNWGTRLWALEFGLGGKLLTPASRFSLPTLLV